MKLAQRRTRRGTPDFRLYVVQSYDTLSLADVYAVFAYCLTHREQIEEYMGRCDSEAAGVRDRVQAAQPDQSGVRERLMQRA